VLTFFTMNAPKVPPSAHAARRLESNMRPGALSPHDSTRERAWRASRRWYVLWLAGRFAARPIPLIVILGGFFLLQHGRADDKSGGRAGQTIGTVTSVILRPTQKNNPTPRWLVSVRLPDLPPPAPLAMYQTVRCRARVRVEYVIGRSGRVYVERIEPFPRNEAVNGVTDKRGKAGPVPSRDRPRFVLL
jgi:hypothetical protein